MAHQIIFFITNVGALISSTIPGLLGNTYIVAHQFVTHDFQHLTYAERCDRRSGKQSAFTQRGTTE